jgi:hypothetical protein
MNAHNSNHFAEQKKKESVKMLTFGEGGVGGGGKAWGMGATTSAVEEYKCNLLQY